MLMCVRQSCTGSGKRIDDRDYLSDWTCSAFLRLSADDDARLVEVHRVVAQLDRSLKTAVADSQEADKAAIRVSSWRVGEPVAAAGHRLSPFDENAVHSGDLLQLSEVTGRCGDPAMTPTAQKVSKVKRDAPLIWTRLMIRHTAGNS